MTVRFASRGHHKEVKTMRNEDYLYIALFAIGLILFAAAIFRKQAGFLKTLNPMVALIIGVALMIPGFYWGVIPLVEGDPPYEAGTQTIVVQDSSGDVQYPSWDITPARSNTTQPALLDSDEAGFTIPFVSNTTQHDIYQQGATTSWYDPEIEFACNPVPFAGADADDLATIFYEVLEPELEVDAATSGPYYAFVKTGGHRRILWHVAGQGQNEFVTGSQTMLMTGNVTMQLVLELDEASLSRMQSTFDKMSFNIKFSNGGGWSKVYGVDLIPVTISATSTPDVW
jgi:hypothetical protein